MKRENLAEKNEKEVVGLISEKRNLLRDFRFRAVKGRAKNVKEGRALRKEIARLLTEIAKRDKSK